MHRRDSEQHGVIAAVKQPHRKIYQETYEKYKEYVCYIYIYDVFSMNNSELSENLDIIYVCKLECQEE